MSKHTPGPWEWAGDDNDLVIRPQRVPEDNKVFVIAVLPLKIYEHLEDWSECSWSAEGEANAHLIAAAPEMKDSLKEIVDALERCMNSPFCVHPKLTNRAKALLRRIDGEEDNNA